MHRAFGTLLLGFSLIFSTSCGATWENAGEVRGAVERAGVIGQPPAEVVRRLAALKFGEGRRLEVGDFQPSRSLIEAQLRDAQNRPKSDWNVNVTVTFDSSKKAAAVDVHSSAVNPL